MTNSSPPIRAAIAAFGMAASIRKRRGTQHDVAGGMAMTVVDLLELVEVEVENCKRRDRGILGQSRPGACRKGGGWEVRPIGRVPRHTRCVHCFLPASGRASATARWRAASFASSTSAVTSHSAPIKEGDLSSFTQKWARDRISYLAARPNDPELRIILPASGNGVLEFLFGALAIVGMNCV